MCGRYFADEETTKEIKELTKQEKLLEEGKTGEIYPKDQVIILTGEKDNHLKAEKQQWGFPGYKKSQLIINARAETALEKPTFKESIQQRRCIILADWFYEWDSKKNKVKFQKKDMPVLYMAGFYKHFSDKNHFIILTTKANTSVADVHDRMPLLLEKEEILDWIYDKSKMEQFLQKEPYLLQKEIEVISNSF